MKELLRSLGLVQRIEQGRVPAQFDGPDDDRPELLRLRLGLPVATLERDALINDFRKTDIPSRCTFDFLDESGPDPSEEIARLPSPHTHDPTPEIAEESSIEEQQEGCPSRIEGLEQQFVRTADHGHLDPPRSHRVADLAECSR
ncbi:hypothetical protein [Actinomadura decatromicini]|uniref:Uncharacterized protein n=1 Tax=Actinomadura decatromicini TaxID=2604572 RepID=A0A5D3FWB5_9ACTN|nr:hypothetical protein [Actinomadura decatromicini]TYK53147.1 hypothetical protein FXF68_05340 [Actinomadura decatromicini]